MFGHSVSDVISSSLEDGRILWLPSKSKLFRVGSTWQCIRQPNQKVPWLHLIWFKGAIPKHSFMYWLAILDRLSTKSREHKINPTIPTVCSFYGLEERSNHLFFECSFSSQVWKFIMIKTGKEGAVTTIWEQVVLWGCRAWKKQTKRNLLVLSWQACVYQIWLERNSVHRNIFQLVHHVIDMIVQDVR